MDESGQRQAPKLIKVNHDRRANEKACEYRQVLKIPKLLNHHPVVVFRPSIHNVVRAIEERVQYVKLGGRLVPPPKPAQEFRTLVPAFTEKFDLAIEQHMTPWSQDRVIETYTGSKRRVYERAKMNLQNRRVNLKDGRIKAFGKFEKVVWDTRNKKFDDLVMRLIQPRSMEYCLELGRFIKPLEKIIISRINHTFNPLGDHRTVMKGLNAVERASEIVSKWDKIGSDAVCLMVDAKRFDQHVSKQALEWEHERYLKYLHQGDRDKYGRLLKMQLENRGIANARDGFVRYRTSGCRMSGDMNTSLGNILIMCGLIWEYMHDLGISDYQLINDGDDSGIIVSAKHINRVSAEMPTWFARRGFTMSLDGVAYDVRQILFCQSSPVRDGSGRWIMVRDPRRCMAKDGVCLKPLPNDAEMYAWMEAVGTGGYHLTYGVPVMEEYYSSYIRSAKSYDDPKRAKRVKKYFETDEHKKAFHRGVARNSVSISEQSRADFDIAFGFSPKEQMLLEEQLRRTLVPPGLYTGPTDYLHELVTSDKA